MLLHYKADANVQDNEGNSPLHVATSHGHEDVSFSVCMCVFVYESMCVYVCVFVQCVCVCVIVQCVCVCEYVHPVCVHE